jgi:creatinine amidohydrolase
MKTHLPLMTPTEVTDAAQRDAIVLVPIGTTEVNGPHLPLGLDHLVAAALAERVADALDGVWLSPITVGVSQALDSFAGTLAVTPENLGDQARSLLRSLVGHGFRQIVVLNNHIPNQFPVEYAIRELRRETDVVVPLIFPAQLALTLSRDIYEGCEYELGHGGEPSTSLMCALHPDAVRLDLIEPRGIDQFHGFDVVSPLEVSFANNRVNIFLDIADLSETGGWGDPREASAERGNMILDRMVQYITRFCEDWVSSNKSPKG